MKQLFKDLYKLIWNEELVHIEYPIKVILPKTNTEKLIEVAESFLKKDASPLDEQPDEVACVSSLTKILTLVIDVPHMTYTPKFLTYLRGDKRFKEIKEFKKGAIIISPTGFGNGSVMGHTGIIWNDGLIMSNSSSTGLWDTKFDNLSWIDRYCRNGGLPVYLFELV